MASTRDKAEQMLTQSLLKDANISYLKELVVPDDAHVDLIAVHGLRIPVNFKPWKDPQSFGVQTWAGGDPGKEILWLKDLLPHDAPGVRVLLFGYNSNVGWDVSTAGVTGAADDLLMKLKSKRLLCPQRPIIFACHSLGGIVVKHAIAKARSNPKYEQLFDSVRGIAFFATPHRGGLAGKQGAAAAGGIRRITRNPRSSIMEALRADSLISFDIHQYFLHSLSRIHIVSFYELKPLPGIGRLVVDKNSAVLGLPYPQEDAVPVPESNHSTVCKFESRTQNYELAISGIADLIEWALQRSPVPTSLRTFSTGSSVSSEPDEDIGSNLNAPFRDMHLAYSYLPDFDNVDLKISIEGESKSTPVGPLYLWPSLSLEQLTGRMGLMGSIQEALLLKRSHQTRLALHGLGGVGKTQIALHLIDWYRSSYPDESIFWINGGNVEVFQQSLTEIALRRNLIERDHKSTEPLDAVLRFLLNGGNGRWLMVVDNADNQNTFFEPLGAPAGTASRGTDASNKVTLAYYIPRCAHGRIVFTTTSKALGERLSMQGAVIEIPLLDISEACGLLSTRLFEDKQSDESPPSYQREIPGQTDLQKLCEYLDCLPLALTQAAAFMRQQNVTIGKYIQLLDKDQRRLSDLLTHDFQASGHWGESSKAIDHTWNITFDRIAADVPIAAELLSVMAFLEPKNIPKVLLQHVVSNDWDLTVTGLGTLESYALVNHASKTDDFSMHRLVQHAMRKRLVSNGSATQWSRKALSVLCEHFPDGGHESWETCAALIPHALHILKNDHSKHVVEVQLVGTLQSKISQYYFKIGLYSQAADLSLEALETLSRLPDAPKTLIYKTKTIRAQALKDHGQLQEAENIAKEVWYERQNELGPKNIETLESYEILALMYQEQGKYKECVKASRQLLKSLRKITNEDDVAILRAKRRLGTILQKLGEYAEAESLLREGLEALTTQLGPDNLLTLKTKWRLAWLLHDEGKYTEAARLSLETWTSQKRLLGADHPDTLKSLFLHASDLQSLSKFPQALAHKRHVHARAVAQIGPKNRYTLMAASSLASCLVASAPDPPPHPCAALDEAAALYNSVLAGLTSSLRPSHPEILSAQHDVATMLRLTNSLSASETLARETLKQANLVLEKHDPLVLTVRLGLARALWAQRGDETTKKKEKEKEALEQAKKVLKARERFYGWGYSGTREVAEFVGEMLPEGKERQQLREKVAKNTPVAVDEEGTVRGVSGGGSIAASEVKRKPVPVASLDDKSGVEEKKTLDDGWFNS